MGLIYRRRYATRNGGTHLNVSLHGLSVTKRVGPFSVNTRGRATVRLLRGLSLRKQL